MWIIIYQLYILAKIIENLTKQLLLHFKNQQLSNIQRYNLEMILMLFYLIFKRKVEAKDLLL
jgi:hypothetical protein